jgi:hypothetical protein
LNKSDHKNFTIEKIEKSPDSIALKAPDNGHDKKSLSGAFVYLEDVRIFIIEVIIIQ